MKRGQALIEFALIFPLFLILLVGILSISVQTLLTERLQHATNQAALSGAAEPSVPDRCDAARDTLTRVLDRAPHTFKCTGIGSLVEITASLLAPNYLPWGNAEYSISISARAEVR